MDSASELYSQLRNECEAMALYAFTSGIKIPSTIIQMLPLCKVETPFEKEEASVPGKSAEVNPETETQSQSIPLRQIALLHGAFSKIIAPATPRTILLIHNQSRKKHFWRLSVPVPIVGQFMMMAIVFLLGWIWISLDANVDGTLDWSKESGFRLLLEELFILFAAGIGACFSILFQVNRFIVRGTYDPKYDSTYWARLVLGIVAGMILALMIPIDTTGSLKALTKPTLALLGGFSVTVVYKILMRLVAAVESLVNGDTAEIIESQVKAYQATADAAQTEDKMRLSSDLMSLREKVDSGKNKEELISKIDEILGEIVPELSIGTDKQPS